MRDFNPVCRQKAKNSRASNKVAGETGQVSSCLPLVLTCGVQELLLMADHRLAHVAEPAPDMDALALFPSLELADGAPSEYTSCPDSVPLLLIEYIIITSSGVGSLTPLTIGAGSLLLFPSRMSPSTDLLRLPLRFRLQMTLASAQGIAHHLQP